MKSQSIRQLCRCFPFVVLVLVFLPVTRTQAAGKYVASVIGLHGTVTVDRADGPQNAVLATHSSLYLGDIVRTSPDGQAEILFTDGSDVKLDSSSAIKVGVTAPVAHAQNFFQALIGTIFAHCTPGTNIHGPASLNISVRGTDVLLTIAADGTTQVIDVTGSVAVSNDKDQGNPVVLGEDQQTTVVPGQAPTAPIVVDPSGLLSWTADVIGLPLVFETPSTSPGDALRAQGDAAGALAAYSSVLTATPNDLDACVGASLTELSQGKPDLAKAALAPVASQPEAIAASGLIDLETGNGPHALTEFQSALSQDPSLYSSDSLLALTLLQQGSLSDAEAAARKAVSLAPSSAQAEGTLSTVLFFEGKTRDAAAAARASVAADPGSPFALLTLGRMDTAAGRYDRAKTEFEKALAFAPNLWLVRQELGDVYEQLGDPERAEEEYLVAIKLDPNSADAYAGLGKAQQDLGQYKDAGDAFKQAYAVNPYDGSAVYYYASYLIDRGQLDEALDLINNFKGKEPNFGLLYARAGEIYLYKQNLFAAQTNAQKAVNLLPTSALAHYELGRVEYEEQHTYQAEQEFRIATVLDPKLATARYALGLVQEKTKSGVLTSFSNIFDSAEVGSPASSNLLYNEELDTPGTNERVQAEVQDASAVRSATRSYGEGEVDVVAGGDGSYTAGESYLSDTAHSRGVAGITANSQFEPGPRNNADGAVNSSELVIGQKSKESSSSYVGLGNFEQTNGGQDDGDYSSPVLADERYDSQLSSLIAGIRLDTGAHGTLQAVLQGADSLYGTRSSLPPASSDYTNSHYDTDFIDGEIRWEGVPNYENDLTIGFSYGDRRRVASLPTSLGTIFFNFAPFQAYVRDSIYQGRRLSFVTQGQFIQQYESINDIFGISSSTESKLVPYIVANYQPNAVDVIRFRYRRLVAIDADFQLLTPTDDFLISYVDLPQPILLSALGTAEGTSEELELDRTIGNGSFFSIGLYRQNLSNADIQYPQEDAVGAYATARIQGIQSSIQGLVGKNLTYFVLCEYADAEETDSGYPGRIGSIPQWTGISSVQYLDRSGRYAQAAYYIQGNDHSGDPATTQPFGILDVRIGKRIGLKRNVFAEINNAFNKSYDIIGTEQERMVVRVGASERF